MNAEQLLRSIREIWLKTNLELLKSGKEIGKNIHDQLDKFFEALITYFQQNETLELEKLITLWASSLPQSDLEESQGSLTIFLNELMVCTSDTIFENLESEEAAFLAKRLIPLFAFCFEKAAQLEIKSSTEFIANRFTRIQNETEQLERSKSNFITIAAHELKTPLTIIEGYTSILKEDTHSQHTINLISGIEKGVIRLKSIITDLIDVSLIDNSLLQLNIQPVWLYQVFRTLEAELQGSFTKRNIHLSIEKFPGLNEPIMADPERLMQVFRNILINAIKYTPDYGSVTISGRKLPGFVETTITDTGIGISTENQSQIFKKFTQLGNISLHSSSKFKFKGGGPGLGLHIAKGIVEALGGAIWVESPGYDESNYPGSTFHIILPVKIEDSNTIITELIDSISSNHQETT